MKQDGNNPTLLYAYGGFEVPRLPSYSAVSGTAWLEKGGVYVLGKHQGRRRVWSKVAPGRFKRKPPACF
jgi:protease II